MMVSANRFLIFTGLTLLTSACAGCAANSLQQNNLHPDNREKPVANFWRAWVENPDALKPLLYPLTDRVALLTISKPGDWTILQKAVPTVGTSPDFQNAIVAGIICSVGTPVDGAWPIKLLPTERSGGRTRLHADLNANSYLPDGATCMELVMLHDVRDVAAVELNKVLYER